MATSSFKPSPRTPRQLHRPTQESTSSLLKVPVGRGRGKNLLPGLQADRGCSCFSFQYVFVVTKRWQKTNDLISLLPPHESRCWKAGSTSHSYPLPQDQPPNLPIAVPSGSPLSGQTQLGSAPEASRDLPLAGNPLENQGWWSPTVSGQWPGCHGRPLSCTETGGVEARLPLRTKARSEDPERLAGSVPKHEPPSSTPIPQSVTHSLKRGQRAGLARDADSEWLGPLGSGRVSGPSQCPSLRPSVQDWLCFGATAGLAGQLLSSTCRGHSRRDRRPGSVESQPPGEPLLS